MKQLLLLLIALFTTASLSARTAAPVKAIENYIYFDAGGGVHGLNYTLKNGEAYGNLGSMVDLGFCYSFSHEWALKIGIGIQSYSAHAILNGSDSINSTDADLHPYVYHTKYIHKSEDQSVLFLDLPIGAQYRKLLSPNFTLQAASAIAFSLPIRQSFETASGEIKTSGHYSQFNLPNLDEPMDQGFGTFTKNFSGNLDLSPSASLSLELGVLYHLKEKMDFYLGSYLNYGFLNIQKKQNNFLFQPNGGTPIYNGVLSSTETTRVNSYSFGVKAGIYYSFVLPKASRRGKLAGGVSKRKSIRR